MFLALVLEPFSLLLDNRAAGLLLLRVDDDVAHPGSDQFTLVFQGPRDLTLLDGVYRIAHITAGTTELFLQPDGRDNRYNYYKASFNLLRAHVPGIVPERNPTRFQRPLYTPRP